jgi:hypothetical protein
MQQCSESIQQKREKGMKRMEKRASQEVVGQKRLNDFPIEQPDFPCPY